MAQTHVADTPLVQGMLPQIGVESSATGMQQKLCGYVPGAICENSQVCDIMSTYDHQGTVVSWEREVQVALECPFIVRNYEALPSVHISDIRAFKSCRQKWDFTSVLRQHMEPKTPRAPLWLGRGVHYALSVYYGEEPRSRTHMLEAFNDWASDEVKKQVEIHASPATLAQLDELRELGDGMLRHYSLWAPKHDNFEVIVSEVRIQTPFIVECGPALFEGVSDMIIKDEHGDYWLFEHKTCARFPDFSLLSLDDQSAAYVWGITQDPKFGDIRPKGAIFNFLRKKKPTIPKRLKSGGLSRSSTQDTTEEVYRFALKHYDLDPAPYADYIDALIKRTRNKGFFQRPPVLVSDKRLARFERNFLAVANDMLCEPDIYPSPDWAWYKCKGCPFSTACMLAMNGADPTPLLEADFRKRRPSYLDYQEKKEEASDE